MDSILQLRTAIEGLTIERLDQQKLHLLGLVDGLQPAFSQVGAHGTGGNGHHQRLSPREREVMNMILDGRRLKEIAATLDISVKTVTTHRSRLLRKLGLDDNLGLYRYGIRNGLIGV